MSTMFSPCFNMNDSASSIDAKPCISCIMTTINITRTALNQGLKSDRPHCHTHRWCSCHVLTWTTRRLLLTSYPVFHASQQPPTLLELPSIKDWGHSDCIVMRTDAFSPCFNTNDSASFIDITTTIKKRKQLSQPTNKVLLKWTAAEGLLCQTGLCKQDRLQFTNKMSTTNAISK